MWNPAEEVSCVVVLMEVSMVRGLERTSCAKKEQIISVQITRNMTIAWRICLQKLSRPQRWSAALIFLVITGWELHRAAMETKDPIIPLLLWASQARTETMIRSLF